MSVASLLPSNTSLTSIEMTGEMITSDGIEVFTEGLLTNVSVRKLKFSGNSFSHVDLKKLFDAIIVNGNITCIDLSRVMFAPDDCEIIASAITVTKSVHSIILNNCSLGYRGVTLILDASLSNPVIKTIELAFTAFGQCMGRKLAEFLSLNRSVTSVNFSGFIFDVSECALVML
jgi:Ran GTPase-activating protein (RanGAP) involved in mRNA processing and transport